MPELRPRFQAAHSDRYRLVRNLGALARSRRIPRSERFLRKIEVAANRTDGESLRRGCIERVSSPSRKQCGSRARWWTPSRVLIVMALSTARQACK